MARVEFGSDRLTKTRGLGRSDFARAGMGYGSSSGRMNAGRRGCDNGVVGFLILLAAAAVITKEPWASSCVAARSQRCKETQKAALLEFYNDGFDKDNWESDWLDINVTDCCEWSGVECDEDGLVVSLDLSGQTQIKFNASLASEPWPVPLAKLRSLKELSMDSFILGSPLPPEIGLLSESLTSLTVRQCQLLPPLPVAALANLSKLTLLDLSEQNAISGPPSFSWYQIPADLCNLTALRSLSLSSNGFGGTIPSCLTLLPHLSRLDLGTNQLIGHIPQHWNASSSLTYLDLSSNFLTGLIYPGLFGENMWFLSLQSNNLTGKLANVMIGNLSELSDLSLGSNALTGSIPVSLGNLTKMSNLDLSNNELSGTIPDQLGNLLNIHTLDLSGNRLSGTIPVSLAKLGVNTSSSGPIDAVFLSSNNLTGDLPWMLLTGHINVLHLSSNHLTGRVADIDNPALLNSSTLEDLDLSSNGITGPIPSWLAHLQGLVFLSLSSNNLVTPTGQFLLSNLSYLQSIDLSSNNLGGGIPSWLYHFTALQSLDLSFNQFKGSIPAWLWSFPQLNSIDLSMNHLSGDIPLGGLCRSLPTLGSFNASHNHLNRLLTESGSLNSSCAGFFDFHLDLHSNYLFGVIPWEWLVGNYTYGLRTLNLADNNFFGEIPEWWLEGEDSGGELDLSHNQLSGNIPSSISDVYFNSLHLSSNNFSGEIPSTLFSTDSMVSLKLDSNSLTGSIPDKLGDCTVLVSLVLRDNLLTGPIPGGLMSNLTANLVVLDLSHNSLEGGIPPWLQQMQSLRVLSLSFNRLSGPLPPTKWNTPQLQLLDLSCNNLSGSLAAQSLSLLQGFLYKSIRITQLEASTTLYDESISIQGKGEELSYTYLLTATVSLDLSNNALAGPIPPELGSLDGLIFLNLSNNQLTGQIPESFGNLTQLNSLDVSKNDLMGEIPETLCSLTFLSFVDVSDNNLSGPIPQCNQWSTFTSQPFLSNKGLCGPPLSVPCTPIRNSTLGSSNQPSEMQDHDADDHDFDFLTAIFVGFCIGFPTCFAITMLWRPIRHPISKVSRWILGKVGGYV